MTPGSSGNVLIETGMLADAATTCEG